MRSQQVTRGQMGRLDWKEFQVSLSIFSRCLGCEVTAMAARLGDSGSLKNGVLACHPIWKTLFCFVYNNNNDNNRLNLAT